MSPDPLSLETARMVLRPWRTSDREPFAAINADPRVMEWFPARLSAAESNAMAALIDDLVVAQSWGLWAVEVSSIADFIGFVGLHKAQPVLGYEAIEIGWRLAAEHWGKGYAPEAALASLAFGFEHLGVDEIVAFTSVGNAKSRRVMEKIGMHHDATRDFDHPRIAPDSPLSRHVLYAIKRVDFDRDGTGDLSG